MTEIREVGPFERILTLTIDADALAAGKRSAAARLSKETKIKGFRPGKAPLRVVESLVGADRLRREAIDDVLPKALASAITETELIPVVYPRLEEVRDQDGGVEVEVRVTLWPTVDRLPEYAERRVQIARPEVTAEDVDAQIERMRHQFAELEDVAREGFDGDYVLVDVRTSLDGEELAAGSATDLLYEVGSGSYLEGMDDALRGSAAGRIAEFQSTLPTGSGEEGGRPVTVRTLVKQVKAKRLPELTDHWVEEVSEFETVAELRTELESEMRRIGLRGARVELEQRLLAELVEDLDLGLPEQLVEAEMDSVFHRFAHRLESQEIGLDDYLSITGQDQAEFLADLRSQAELNLRTRILLEAVAEREGIEVAREELDETIAGLAAAARLPEEQYRRSVAEGAGEETLSGDILRRKAVDRLVELVVPVDEEGNQIELPAPAAPAESERAEQRGEGPGDAPDEPEGEPEPTEVEE